MILNMSVYCPYCSLVMIYEEPHNVYRCAPCLVTQQFVAKGTKTWLQCYVGKEDYTVCMDGCAQETSITYWVMTPDGFGIGEPVITIPFLVSLTPQNVKEKVSLYLVFS
jgi:hypothetical protein